MVTRTYPNQNNYVAENDNGVMVRSLFVAPGGIQITSREYDWAGASSLSLTDAPDLSGLWSVYDVNTNQYTGTQWTLTKINDNCWNDGGQNYFAIRRRLSATSYEAVYLGDPNMNTVRTFASGQLNLGAFYLVPQGGATGFSGPHAITVATDWRSPRMSFTVPGR